jgi:outer membrane protein assembly factor BamB
MKNLVLILSLSLCQAATEWPQWRGPDATGISQESNLPISWSKTENVAWKTDVPGRGHSSPIVWGTRIFFTSSIEGPVVPGAKAPKHILEGQEFVHPDSVGADHSYRLLVLCFDRDSGKLLWERTAYDGAVYDNRHKKSSYAAPTPITDGKNVFAYFGTEGLYSYDFDGNLQWKMSPGKIGTLGIGVAGSLVMDDERIFLQCDQDGQGSFAAAVDKRTGKEVWRVARDTRVGWVTPLLIRGEQRSELILTAAEAVISYDPRTGKELWRSAGVVGNALPSAVTGLGMIFVFSGYPDKRAIAIPLGGSGKVAEKWMYSKGTAYVPSPILFGDYLYLISDRGLLTCLEARTGKPMYEGARPPKPGYFSASPVAFDGKLFLTNEDGDTFVVKAGPQFEVLGTNSLDEPVFASLAMTDGRIFIRAQEHLYCIRRTGAAGKPSGGSRPADFR